MDGSREVAEAGSKEGLMVGGVIDGGDLPDQPRNLLDQGFDPEWIEVFLPAHPPFALRNCTLGFFILGGAMEAMKGGLGNTSSGFGVGEQPQPPPEAHATDAANKAGDEKEGVVHWAEDTRLEDSRQKT